MFVCSGFRKLFELTEFRSQVTFLCCFVRVCVCAWLYIKRQTERERERAGGGVGERDDF